MRSLSFCFAILTFIFSSAVAATPLMSPYAVKSSMEYEGGYQLELQVCAEKLCQLKISTPNMRIRVPKDKLAEIVDPNIGLAVLYAELAAKGTKTILVEIPYIDFDRKFLSKKVYVIEIRNGAFYRASAEDRGDTN